MDGKVMVVDDNEDIVASVKSAFKKREPKLEVIGLTSGKKALEAMLESPPDIVLLDVMMPEMDGWTVASKMKEDPVMKGIPIVYLTAKTDDLSQKMGAIGSEDYITKPYDNDDLVNRVKDVIQKERYLKSGRDIFK
ncbi:MAG: response regulator [Candidatus Altiarchaeota archaeon]